MSATLSTPAAGEVLPTRGYVEITATGPLTLLQDTGRPGLAAMGVTASGSFDRLSAARANHAVGNVPQAPLLEVLMGGLAFRCTVATSMIVTGANCPVVVDGRRYASNTIIDLEPGAQVSLEPASYGLRAYVALRGGVGSGQEVLGSAATDTLSGIGPAPVKVGAQLAVVGSAVDPEWWPQLRHIPPVWQPRAREELHVIMGPRADWFTGASLMSFLAQDYVVSASSNRIGVRLEGPEPLERSRKDELKSEGMVRGAIQVPPNGQPVVFGPDHPVTGGYPVIAALTARSCDRLAQLTPGTQVSFSCARR